MKMKEDYEHKLINLEKDLKKESNEINELNTEAFKLKNDTKMV